MEKKKLVAISKDETKVFIVKNVNEQEYNRLRNKESENDSVVEKEKLDIEDRLEQHRYNISLLFARTCILAKSIYDNFVDRGLLENDENFQQMWFDFYFNDSDLDLEKAPQEYKTILAKVGNLQ